MSDEEHKSGGPQRLHTDQSEDLDIPTFLRRLATGGDSHSYRLKQIEIEETEIDASAVSKNGEYQHSEAVVEAVRKSSMDAALFRATGMISGAIYEFLGALDRFIRVLLTKDKDFDSRNLWASPPQLALTLLTLWQSEERSEEAQGDLTEDFDRTLERHGAFPAHVGIWVQAILVLLFKLFWKGLDWAGRLLLLDVIWKWIRG